MIAGLVPAGVYAKDAFGDRGPLADVTLFPAELTAVQGESEDRRREFTTVRGCARAALAELGVAPAPLVPRALGAPRWPAGVVGTMTHCRGYRAAAVARAARFAALGIDAEPLEPLPPAVAARIANARESAWLRDDFAPAGPPPERLLFSAKEASYKAFSPWLGDRFGFRDFTVRIRPDGTFRVTPPDSGTPLPATVDKDLTGYWIARHGFVVTVVAVPGGRPS
ncbi:4'-phosphopantetheinyl transferase family protein [Streptomyces bullii]|uniref:4'-phosphopantetheinyl transferase n=1 Tax=Streptomyces bullii TaxID=349910 RepID=A0ABW0UTV0_9ACTN